MFKRSSALLKPSPPFTMRKMLALDPCPLHRRLARTAVQTRIRGEYLDARTCAASAICAGILMGVLVKINGENLAAMWAIPGTIRQHSLS
jgi:hypothetical protein